MYEEFFSYFGLRANPFHVSPDPRFYIPTPAYESALSEIKFGIQTRQGLMVLTGDAGTGKTTLMQLLLEWLHESGHSSSYIFHSLLEPADLFSFILRDFGIPCASMEKGKVLQALHEWLVQRHAQGDTPVIVIDEAQVLLPQTLDELRLLLNLETPAGKLVQIVLAGQQELEVKLRRPELRQLRQRIVFHSRIAKMTLEETSSYISSRLASAGGSADIYPAETVESIHTFSSGIPRVVNLLCEHSLIGAYAAQEKNVSQETVQRVAAEFDLAAKPMAWETPAEASRYSRLLLFPLTEAKIPAALAHELAAATPAASAHMIHPDRVATGTTIPVGVPAAAFAAAASAGAHSSASVSPATSPAVKYSRSSSATPAVSVHAAPPLASELSRQETPRWKKVSTPSAFWPDLRSQFYALREYLAGTAASADSTPHSLKKYSDFLRSYSAGAGAHIQSVLPPARVFIGSVRKYFAEVVQSFVHDWRTWMPSSPADRVSERKQSLRARISRAKSRSRRSPSNMVTPITAWLKQPMANAQGVARLRKKHL